LNNLGRHDEALPELRRAAEIDPAVPLPLMGVFYAALFVMRPNLIRYLSVLV